MLLIIESFFIFTHRLGDKKNEHFDAIGALDRSLFENVFVSVMDYHLFQAGHQVERIAAIIFIVTIYT